MSTYVLVHGALGSGWQFTGVAQRLRCAGHEVFTPTLTGLGERAHLAGPEIGLDTHVRDITALFDCEDLSDVALVGADYGGVVIAAAAVELAGRVSRLVYVAGLIPRDGTSTLDLLPPAARDCVRQLAQDHDGWRVPRGEQFLSLWGITDPVQRDWWAARLSPFPIRCWEQPAHIPDDAASEIHREYVELAETSHQLFGPAAARALEEGWGYHRIQAGHSAWINQPDLLTAVLHLCATEPDDASVRPSRINGPKNAKTSAIAYG